MARQKKIYDDIHSDKDMQAMIKNINTSLKGYFSQFGDAAFYQSRKGIVESILAEDQLSTSGGAIQIKNTKDLRSDEKAMQSLYSLQYMLTPTELKKKFQRRAKETDGQEFGLRSKELINYMNDITRLEAFTKENLTYIYDDNRYKEAENILKITGRRKTWEELKIVEGYIAQAMAMYSHKYQAKRKSVKQIVLDENVDPENSSYFG